MINWWRVTAVILAAVVVGQIAYAQTRIDQNLTAQAVNLGDLPHALNPPLLVDERGVLVMGGKRPNGDIGVILTDDEGRVLCSPTQ